jgi:hypothetical protein
MDEPNYTSDGRGGAGADLAQTSEAHIKVGESILQDLAMMRVMRCLELLYDACASEKQALLLPHIGGLLRCQALAVGSSTGSSISLLLLNGLALPAPCHIPDYRWGQRRSGRERGRNRELEKTGKNG